MEPTKRIFVNTVAQYVKSFINLCLSLYTVPLILKALGDSDYGIYCLIAGIVAMLSFVTNALVVTTQRHISYSIGQNDADVTRKVFSNSVLLHLAVGVILALLILAFKDFSLHHLKFDAVRLPAASTVYQMSVAMIFVSFVTAPFKALLIAHENIVFMCVIEILDGLLKLTLTLLLLGMDVDKLLIYSYMMISVFLFEFIIYSVYAICRYSECRPSLFFRDFNPVYLKQLGCFAGWTTYGMGVVVCRTQGLAVIFNHFLNIAANAAYGLATHLYSAVAFVATSVTNAMNPQIMQAEGRSDRAKMLELAELESKILTVLMSLAFIPLIVEMDGILEAWVRGPVPEYTTLLCQCLLIMFLADQFTYGLHSANQATGNIMWYTIIMYTPKLLFLALAWITFQLGGSLLVVMIELIAVEAVMAVARLPFLKRTVNLDVMHFCLNVYGRVIPLIIVLTLTGLVFKHIMTFNLSFLLSVPATVLVGLCIVWTVSLRKSERDLLLSLVKRRKNG